MSDRFFGMVVWGVVAVILLAGCGGKTRQLRKSDFAWDGREPERGVASWYGGKFHGRKTASGEVYNKNDLTAAHKTLPFGTVVLVRNLQNGRESLLEITDRGPFVAGRIIDVSERAARDLDMITAGVVPSEVYVMRRKR
jgi:rare lipoprotein A